VWNQLVGSGSFEAVLLAGSECHKHHKPKRYESKKEVGEEV
jgi:hypothetical protein